MKDEYFEILYDMATSERFPSHVSYKQLLYFLYSTPFIYVLEEDRNRSDDGLYLRSRILEQITPKFTNLAFQNNDLNCSILELILSLSERMEQILASFDYGDRRLQWVWNMLNSMGVSQMTDDIYDEKYVTDAVMNMMYRKYTFDGKGSLFFIPNSKVDMRVLPIWDQVNQFVTYLTL